MDGIYAHKAPDNFVEDVANSLAIGCHLRLVLEHLEHIPAQPQLIEVPLTKLSN